MEARKCPADDLMLALCDDLLTSSPTEAREFYANPAGASSDKSSWFSTVAREDMHTWFRVYGSRATWLSLEERSPERLRSGLLAFVLSDPGGGNWRDLLVALAPYHHCAQVLGLDIPLLFEQAGRYAQTEQEQYYATFGRRRDVTLGVFGWVEIQTPHGIRFRQNF